MLRQHTAAANQAGRVIDMSRHVFRVTDQHTDLGHRAHQLIERTADLQPQAAMEQQILGRITGKRELREHHQIGAQLIARTPRLGDDALEITAHVPHQQIQLRQRDSEPISVS